MKFGLIEAAVPSPASLPARSVYPEWLARLGLIVAATLATLLVLELVLRTCWGYLLLWPNFVVSARTALADQDRSRYVHDDLLGYVPRAGYAAAGVTIDANGLRHTADLPASQTAGAILTVGDSFTFGAEVSDRETWPAHLQTLTGQKVLNGGVSGYGFDQIVLRAESLAATLRPSVIVVGFIADDIRRTEMRRLWSADKPYFELDHDTQVLRNVPVPPRAEPSATLNFWQRTLGYSFLFEFILRRLDLLHDWFGDHVRVHPADSGERIACRLTSRLAALQDKSGARVLVLAEYDPVVWQNADFSTEQRRLTGHLLRCAKQNGLDVLDSFDAMAGHKGGPSELYVLWHMNAEGNQLIAGFVAGWLGKRVH